jgi:hypothetical protein
VDDGSYSMAQWLWDVMKLLKVKVKDFIPLGNFPKEKLFKAGYFVHLLKKIPALDPQYTVTE